RGGTENIPAIAGFKKAIEILKDEMNADIEKSSGLRNKLISELSSQIGNKMIINSHQDNSPLERGTAKQGGVFIPNIVNISFNPETTKIDPDTLLIKLDM
ncbi:MAG TPA: hypothetical protein PLN22_05365, partial [Ignavibacteria bacterium]|nr:hypothetical protein [Ignavibacteria bacterium]